YGLLTVNADGSWTYILTNPVDNGPNGDPVFDNFSYIITDQDGDTATATQTIEIIADDTPTTGVDDGVGTEPDEQFIVYEAGLGSDPEPTEVTIVTGNVMANDNIGADGATITQIEID